MKLIVVLDIKIVIIKFGIGEVYVLGIELVFIYIWLGGYKRGGK